MKLLLEAATSAGFLATYCMDYPHRTTAKKFYIMLSKLYTNSKHVQTGTDQEEGRKTATATAITAMKQSLSRCCNLAWPATASCSLPWLTWREGNDPCAARACASRVVQEHLTVGKRILRLLRHASSCGGALAPPTLLSTSHSGTPDDGTNLSGQEKAIIEIAVPHQGFTPCGGPFMLQLQVNEEILLENGKRVVESRKRKNRGEEGEEEVEDAGGFEVEISEIETAVQVDKTNDDNEQAKDDADDDERTLSPVLATLVQRLLGCNDAEMIEAYISYPKAKNSKTHQKGQKAGKINKKVEDEIKKVESTGGSWPEHLQLARQRGHNTTLKTPNPSSSTSDLKKQTFFYLEHVTGKDSAESDNFTSDNIAILHATKPPLPEILVLTSDYSKIDGGSGGGSLQSAQRQLIALCQNRNASVIGVDMLVHSLENVSCAWLVYVPGLQTTERKAIWEQWSRWQQQQ